MHDAAQCSYRGGRTRFLWMSVRGQACTSYGWCTKAHDDVQQGCTIIKVPFADSAGTVPFAVGARTECVYFEFTQVYIAQGKPIKLTRKILKNAQQKSCQWLTQCEVPLDIDV
jgi:hypothetical protein